MEKHFHIQPRWSRTPGISLGPSAHSQLILITEGKGEQDQGSWVGGWLKNWQLVSGEFRPPILGSCQGRGIGKGNESSFSWDLPKFFSPLCPINSLSPKHGTRSSKKQVAKRKPGPVRNNWEMVPSLLYQAHLHWASLPNRQDPEPEWGRFPACRVTRLWTLAAPASPATLSTQMVPHCSHHHMPDKWDSFKGPGHLALH